MTELALAPAQERSFYTFHVHGQLCGLDLAQVREVSTNVTCSPVPQAPPLVRGLANLRSRIYLVLDVGAAVGGQPSELGSESRLIVLQQRVGEQLALLVDRGGDVVRASADQIEQAVRLEDSAVADAPQSPVVALCKLERGLMLVVDPARIITALEKTIR